MSALGQKRTRQPATVVAAFGGNADTPLGRLRVLKDPKRTSTRLRHGRLQPFRTPNRAGTMRVSARLGRRVKFWWTLVGG